MNAAGPFRMVDIERLTPAPFPTHGAVKVLSAALTEKVCVVCRRADRHRFRSPAEEVAEVVSLQRRKKS